MGYPELCEKHAEKSLLELLEARKITLDVRVKLESLTRLQINMEGGVRLRALLELTEDPHFDWRAPIFADDHLLKIHKEHLYREEVTMVR